MSFDFVCLFEDSLLCGVENISGVSLTLVWMERRWKVCLFWSHARVFIYSPWRVLGIWDSEAVFSSVVCCMSIGTGYGLNWQPQLVHPKPQFHLWVRQHKSLNLSISRERFRESRNQAHLLIGCGTPKDCSSIILDCIRQDAILCGVLGL